MSGTGGMLRVLTYHRVVEADRLSDVNPLLLSATREDFERQIRHLAERYRVVDLEAVLEAQRGGRPLPARAVLLTFDDAYRDFAEIAWPILRRHGMPATVFVATAYPGDPDRRFWWDRLYRTLSLSRDGRWPPRLVETLRLNGETDPRKTLRRAQDYLKALPHDEAMEEVDRICSEESSADASGGVMSWRELRTLAAEGVVLAPHTRTHPALTRVSPDELRAEVSGSREDLRREIGRVAPAFAYPFGEHDDAVIRVVREEGFQMAFSCLRGQSPIPSSEPFRLRRINVMRRTPPLVFRLRLLGWFSRIDGWRHAALKGFRRRHLRGGR